MPLKLALLALVAAAATGAASDAAVRTSPLPTYAAATREVQQQGRAVVALVEAGDADAIFERFTPGLARSVPRKTVSSVIEGTLASAPVGARLGESLLPAGRDRRIYVADHRWGTRSLVIQVVFTRTGAIDGIDVRPRTPLPPDPLAGRRLKTSLALPFSGTWWVFWGGPTARQNYHVVAPDQRHAYDFAAWQSGATHRGDGTRNDQYWAWGRAVRAPAAGVVVAAVDGIADNRPQVQIENRRAPAGNHVVLDLGNGEFVLLAHLRRGSVAVRRGQHVRAGRILGRCGNSGNTSEPHLHLHVQDRAQLFGEARGLPVAFSDYVADGRRVGRGTPVQGQFLHG